MVTSFQKFSKELFLDDDRMIKREQLAEVAARLWPLPLMQYCYVYHIMALNLRGAEPCSSLDCC